ncbi:hypothetical protein BDW72DRAFT_192237 [Aspergillus terricola var. indicus]
MSYWDVQSQDWRIPGGEMQVSVRFSSQDLPLHSSVTLIQLHMWIITDVDRSLLVRNRGSLDSDFLQADNRRNSSENAELRGGLRGTKVHPCRKILLVVTTGGFTHAAPVLEIRRVLAESGHQIEFATPEGQESWVKADEYGFVNKLHQLGPGPTPEQLDRHYRRMQAWDISKGIGQAMGSKYLWDSFWPQTYHNLKKTMDDRATRPDMVVADFFVEAVNDIHYEYKLPIATVCPNMPAFQLPCPYIPGYPGLQLPGTMTSEDTPMWLRIMNEIFCLPDLPAIIRLGKWTKKMRQENGVYYLSHKTSKPDYLIFVNSFFGLEIPRDLPPTATPTADMRMSAFKAKNWDLYAVSALALITFVGSTWLAGRFAWRFRGPAAGEVQSVALSCWEALKNAANK